MIILMPGPSSALWPGAEGLCLLKLLFRDNLPAHVLVVLQYRPKQLDKLILNKDIGENLKNLVSLCAPFATFPSAVQIQDKHGRITCPGGDW